MLLEEEARKREDEMVGRDKKVFDVQTLREILRESLAAFEEALGDFPADEREEALSVYLNKIRKVTFGFHLAVLRRTARSEFGRNPTCEAMQTIIEQSAEEMQRIARLYRFL